jgi:hypothetical protein
MCTIKLSIVVLLVILNIFICLGSNINKRTIKEKQNLLIISSLIVFILSYSYLLYYYPMSS